MVWQVNIYYIKNIKWVGGDISAGVFLSRTTHSLVKYTNIICIKYRKPLICLNYAKIYHNRTLVWELFQDQTTNSYNGQIKFGTKVWKKGKQ